MEIPRHGPGPAPQTWAQAGARVGPTCPAGRVALPHPIGSSRSGQLFSSRAQRGWGEATRLGGQQLGPMESGLCGQHAHPEAAPSPAGFQLPRPGLRRARCVLAPAPTPGPTNRPPRHPFPVGTASRSQWEPAGAGGAGRVPPSTVTGAAGPMAEAVNSVGGHPVPGSGIQPGSLSAVGTGIPAPQPRLPRARLPRVA